MGPRSCSTGEAWPLGAPLALQFQRSAPVRRHARASQRRWPGRAHLRFPQACSCWDAWLQLAADSSGTMLQSTEIRDLEVEVCYLNLVDSFHKRRIGTRYISLLQIKRWNMNQHVHTHASSWFGQSKHCMVASGTARNLRTIPSEILRWWAMQFSHWVCCWVVLGGTCGHIRFLRSYCSLLGGPWR